MHETGSFVEITDGWSGHAGRAAIVESVEGDGRHAIVRPITDDEPPLLTDERIRLHVRHLLPLPTPTEMRREKIKHRAAHLAVMRGRQKQPNPYEYQRYVEMPRRRTKYLSQ